MEGTELSGDKLIDISGNIEILSAIGVGWNG